MSAADVGAGSRLARSEGRLFDDRSAQLDRFGPVLGLTILAVGTMSLVDLRDPAEEALGKVVATSVGLLIGLTLLLALRASGVARRWRRLADALFVLASVFSLGTLAVSLAAGAELSTFSSGHPSPIWVAIALVTPLAVIRRLVKHPRVTRATLVGAVAAYLLIALAACYVFLLVDGAQSEPFLTGPDAEASTSFMYFSLVTITTTGYGDLAATTPLDRLLATGEAVVGQVYLVTFVATLVGLLIRHRPEKL
ncbi:MAG TPA: potassium channel family protein [Gaiellaceae bacterium]|nr:potassium channel family protein [Gaiellaceae bacterium]